MFGYLSHHEFLAPYLSAIKIPSRPHKTSRETNSTRRGGFLDDLQLPVHHHQTPTVHTPNMAVKTESFLHLARPLAPSVMGVQPTTSPLNVIIQPQVRLATKIIKLYTFI